MKYSLASCALFALLSCPLDFGLQIDSSAHAAESQRFISTAAPRSAKPATTSVAANQRQAECVAKVILHEAGNQIIKGKLAVAQVIRERMKQKHSDACGVVHEAGQFFNIERFRPDRSSAQWREAMGIARLTLAGKGKDVVPGAIFFRSGGRPFKGRMQIARIDDHIFYR
jgi:N-acetylmuramoyl-L-alanine amidase